MADVPAPATPVAASKPPLPVVDLVLAPSMGLLRVASTLHVAALALLPFAMQPGLAMAALAAGIALSWWALRRSPALGLGPQALQRISFHADGSVTVYRAGRAAKGLPARLLGSSLVTAALVLLRFELLAPVGGESSDASARSGQDGARRDLPTNLPRRPAALLGRLMPARAASRALGGDELPPDLLRRLRLRLALHREEVAAKDGTAGV